MKGQPSNFVRLNALSRGLLPVRPGEHRQDALIAIIGHLKSLETEQTYENGLVYTEPGTGTALCYDVKDKEGNIGECLLFQHKHVTQSWPGQLLRHRANLRLPPTILSGCGLTLTTLRHLVPTIPILF
jgi:hypothetical protein